MKSRTFLLAALMIPAALLSSCRSEPRYLTLFGYDGFKNYTTDAVFLAADDLGYKANKLLSRTKSSYKDDFRVMDEDPYVMTSTNRCRASSLLKRSDLVIFAYRPADVLSSLEDPESYTVDLKEKDLTLFDYYTELTFEEFRARYSCKSLVLGLYDGATFDEGYKSLIDEFNEVLKSKAQDYEMTYLDTTFLAEYLDGGSLKNDGLHRLSQAIKDAV